MYQFLDGSPLDSYALFYIYNHIYWNQVKKIAWNNFKKSYMATPNARIFVYFILEPSSDIEIKLFSITAPSPIVTWHLKNVL